jgi:hypothetical protein
MTVKSLRKCRQSNAVVGVSPHDCIVALRADQSGFLTVVSAEMIVVMDASVERERIAGRSSQQAK